jgi:hypothetical protein
MNTNGHEIFKKEETKGNAKAHRQEISVLIFLPKHLSALAFPLQAERQKDKTNLQRGEDRKRL